MFHLITQWTTIYPPIVLKNILPDEVGYFL